MAPNLEGFLKSKIQKNKGFISFAEFMDHALYHPESGYYTSTREKIGSFGDFITAPEISSLWARTLANLIKKKFESLNETNILEIGAGTGKLACDLLNILPEKGIASAHYFILEKSPALQKKQQNFLKQSNLYKAVHWLQDWPLDFKGIILINEVLDAFPVHLFHWSKPYFFERGVGLNPAQQFIWKEKSMTNHPNLESAAYALPHKNFGDDYCSEICLDLVDWFPHLSRSLRAGSIVIFDYGFLESDYYHPERRQGTLMCHFQHHAHSNPLIQVGQQDITAHVNFTQVAELAYQHDLKIEAYSTQAYFLIELGILQEYELLLRRFPNEKLKLQMELHRLLEFHEMGELFKCMILTRTNA